MTPEINVEPEAFEQHRPRVRRDKMDSTNDAPKGADDDTTSAPPPLTTEDAVAALQEVGAKAPCQRCGSPFGWNAEIATIGVANAGPVPFFVISCRRCGYVVIHHLPILRAVSTVMRTRREEAERAAKAKTEAVAE